MLSSGTRAKLGRSRRPCFGSLVLNICPNSPQFVQAVSKTHKAWPEKLVFSGIDLGDSELFHLIVLSLFPELFHSFFAVQSCPCYYSFTKIVPICGVPLAGMAGWCLGSISMKPRLSSRAAWDVLYVPGFLLSKGK